MEDKRTLFISFDRSEWDGEDIQHTLEVLDSATPNAVSIVAVPDDIEYLDENEVRELANELLEALTVTPPHLIEEDPQGSKSET